MAPLRFSALLLALARYAAAVTVNVTVGTTYQTIDGFGFSQAFGRANDVKNSPAAEAKMTLDLLFSTTTGAGFTILRNRIGSGGSGDSIEPTSPGSPSATPSYTWDGNDSGQVWFSTQALSYGVKTFYADAWSAPGFMKTNGVETNGGYLCGVTGETCSSGDWRQAYANFLVQYVKYYATAGITITHLGFLNEPELVTSYSSMLSSGTQAASFITVLAPTVKSAGLNLAITCCDAEGWNDQVTFTSQLIAAGVESSLGVITSHSYTSNPSTPISTKLKVWQTENADLSDAFTPNNWYSSGAAGEGLTWATKIYNAIVTANCSAYLYWEGAEIGTTDSTLISIDSSTYVPTASKRLWAFAQWSRYVRPGAVRVATSASTGGLYFSAFKNTDTSLSVQVINSGTTAQSVTIAPCGYTATSAVAYVSAQGTDLGSLSITFSGGQATGSAPAHSMVTFVMKGSLNSTATCSGSTGTGGGGGTGGCTQALYGQCGGIGGCSIPLLFPDSTLY
ncbi:glycoside hydrolase [Clavulina sp. PMI_390]|nr:glycoside hydrolase [Clavulina sp. PMI_390]